MLINRRCKNCPKNDTCTNKYKTEIVTDINDLPNDVQTLITTDIKKRLLPQAEFSFITGGIEGATQYVNNEIQKADNTIQKIIAEAYNDNHLSYLEKISEIVVYNIERKKMLQKFINDHNRKKQIQALTNKLTQREKFYLDKAEHKGYIERTNDGYKSKFKTKALLAYFLELVFCRDENGKDNKKKFPETQLNKLFNEKRLGKARGQIYNNKGSKPEGYLTVDNIFKEVL